MKEEGLEHVASNTVKQRGPHWRGLGLLGGSAQGRWESPVRQAMPRDRTDLIHLRAAFCPSEEAFEEAATG